MYMLLLHARKTDHLECSQICGIASKLKKHKQALVLGYKETQFRVNTHKPVRLLIQWKNPHTIPITLMENPKFYYS
jgi:hypothetical protein